MTTPYTIYFAGDLFDHKHLIGNAILASYIESCSNGQYKCIVPQNLEQPTGRGVFIRNNDLRAVLECDLGLFNFDGADLDSGTVAEFMYAKALDIPAVLFRSDLRARSESPDRNGWNVMCSYYPRTQIVRFNGMARYKEAAQDGATLAQITERMYNRIAGELIAALDQVRQEPPLPKGDQRQLLSWYQWAVRFPGSGYEDLFAAPGYLEQIIERKQERGLL